MDLKSYVFYSDDKTNRKKKRTNKIFVHIKKGNIKAGSLIKVSARDIIEDWLSTLSMNQITSDQSAIEPNYLSPIGSWETFTSTTATLLVLCILYIQAHSKNILGLVPN